MVLIVSQMAFAKVAKTNNGNAHGHAVSKGNENAPGQVKKQLRMLSGYQNFGQVKMRVNGETVKFDTPPVLKTGVNRTMIPVRAVTEALGCNVYWIDPRAYIVNPVTGMIIIFDLETGLTYVIDDMDINDFIVEGENGWEEVDPYPDIDGYEIDDIDSPPGLISDRTFVPLRFVAETFDLQVGYDKKNVIIDIDGGPVLWKQVVKTTTCAALDVEVNVRLNDHELVGIRELDGVDLTEDVEYTSGSALMMNFDTLITFKWDDYLDDLSGGKHEFEFVFEDDDKAEVPKIFKLFISNECDEEEDED